MTSRLVLFGGIGLATLGVGGLAAGGIAWNFQGRPLGFGATVASLVVIGISLVILRPQPTEPVLEPVGFNEAIDGGKWQRSYFNAFSGTIGGGTSQIQKNIIGERVLGLPKD